jgi:hypothetical protein
MGPVLIRFRLCGNRKNLIGAVLVSTLVALLGACNSGATQLKADAPDPSVIWSGSSYVLSTTNSNYGNVPSFASSDLSSWSFRGDELPHLPGWARGGYTWAPSVVRISATQYNLYYSAAVVGQYTPNGQPLKCIGVATALTATGPFTPTSATTPLVCDYGTGDIDPSTYFDGSTLYLVYKLDANSRGGLSRIYSRPFSSNGTSFTGGAVNLLTAAGGWEGNVVEGPSMATVNGGQPHLIYSAGNYASSSYGEGQSVCRTVSTPCSRNGRLLQGGSTYGYGAGGATIFSNGHSAKVICWHGYANANATGPRYLYVAPLSVSGSTLSVPANGTPAAAAGAISPYAAPRQPGPAITRSQLTIPAGTPLTVPFVVPRTD